MPRLGLDRLHELHGAAVRYVHHFRASERERLTDAVRFRHGGRYARLTHGLVRYEVAGPAEGPWVVLVPGFSVACHIWDPIFERLPRAGYRVLRYDLYGRGLSERPRVRYDRELFDQQLVGLLAALDIDGPVHLAGVSVGGPIAVTFAARRPAQVRSVTLVDPRSPAAQRLPWHVRAPIVGECHMALVRAPFLADSQTGDFFEPERFPEWARRFREFMRYDGFQRALLATMRHYLQQDLSDDYRVVGRSALPLLVVWGEHDAGARDVVGQLRALMPQAEFRSIARAGHLPQYERPESVGPILVGFLGQHRAC